MKDVKDFVLNYIKESEPEFSGVISINEKQDVLCREAFGYAIIHEKIKNNINTRFGMASGCKIFTAVAILKLIEEKKMTLETPINPILNQYKLDQEITIKQLLTHTSGIPDYFDEEVMDDFEELWKEYPNYSMQKPEDFFKMFINNRIKFEPGTQFSYSNSGYVVLAHIVEQISGMSFPQYVQKKIFDPAGMALTGYYRFDNLPGNTAYGYIYDEKLKITKTNIYSLPVIGGGDGGCYTTAGDMASFWIHLNSGKLIPKELIDLLFKLHIETEDDGNYGLGVWVSRDLESTYFVQGFDPGVILLSYFNRKSERIVTVLANVDYDADKITQELISQFIK